MTRTTSGRADRPRRLAPQGLALAVGAGSLVAAGLGIETASAESATSQYGTLTAASGALPAPNRCGTYRYSYTMTPPAGDWALETFVTDPRGFVVSSGAVLSNYTTGNKVGSVSYVLCSNNTAPGVFTLSGKFSIDDGTGTISEAQMTPVHYTLVKAPKVKKHQHKKKDRNKKNR